VVGITGNLRVNSRIFNDILAVSQSVFGETVNITGKLDVFDGANIRLTTTR
jgi:hypothetical protein